MKRTDLAKNDGLKITNRLKQAVPPDRFARASQSGQGQNVPGSNLMEKLLGKTQPSHTK